jgi:hypothetical protein
MKEICNSRYIPGDTNPTIAPLSDKTVMRKKAAWLILWAGSTVGRTAFPTIMKSRPIDTGETNDTKCAGDKFQ